MTSLSWLIYLSDAVDKFGKLVGVGAFLALICAVCCMFVFFAASDNGNDSASRTGLKGLKVFASAAVGLGLIASLMPSRTTVLMIAATETTATAVNTPAAQEMLNDVKDIIRNKLKELKSERK